MATSPIFTSTGIASGIDWGPMIDQLVTLESAPITALQQKQAAYRTQISDLGTLTSKISALQTAAKALGDNGVLSVKAVRVADVMSRLAAVLGTLKEAMESRDHVLLADILQYEMDDILRQWEVMLDAVIEHIEGRPCP